MMYTVGDKVSHPVHGAGIISSIVEQKVGGKQTQYYVLKLYNSSMTVMIPVESCENIGVRPIIDGSAADNLIQKMKSMEIEQQTNWGKRYRENMEHLKSGDLVQVARVIKSLMKREKEHGISAGEKTMLAAAKKILLAELMIAKSCEYCEAEQLMNSAV